MDLEKKTQEKSAAEEAGENKESPVRKRWFGRGIYQSKDVPIRLLDGLIGVVIAVILLLILVFAINGGYRISFDTDGGSEVAYQELRYGELVAEPETPAKPGYDFAGWYQENEPEDIWNFNLNKVGGDMTLIASWTPAKITVKFDLAGGTVDGTDTLEPMLVTYGEAYGELPTPQKENAQFQGWSYSGQTIEADTVVAMTGEHVLTASWK